MTKKKETKVIKKNKGGRPTIYNKGFAKKFTDDLACMGLEEAIKKHNISERTYYYWIHKHEELLQLSIRARENKAHAYFDKATKILEEAKDPEKINLDRFKFDGYLRLAGKANQGLYGDKGLTVTNNTQINNNTTIEVTEQLDEHLLGLIDINKKLEKNNND